MKNEHLSREKEIYNITLWGSMVNFMLLIFKFVAGIVGHSSAMIADAVHSLSDFATDIIIIAFVRISEKPQDENHDYGHGKYETFATAIIGTVLLSVGIGILIDSTRNIIAFCNGERIEAPGMLALAAALISILSKEAIYRYTMVKGKRLNSKAVMANAWHHRSDALSSVGTLVGIGGSIFLGKSWRVLDPLAALVVSLFIIKVSVRLIKPCIDELLEKSLPKEIEDKILDIILSFSEVRSPHHLRTRYIGNRIAIEVHIRMNGDMTLKEAHDITKKIEASLKEEFGENTHIGIHMEPQN
ncbi:cation diffusion facilitator family transporter [Xylanibacter caecicola]|uniref:cation diffusion facilitator family transporter n=1 Tax=Xylanibacter caecicola TaxID=2736294 RepID=UPI00258D4AA2|nr:cation diffusion facilitator family transporter [Xylanibacter caecicola]